MTARVLPPPTDLDLAVIRARVDGRDWFGPRGARRWGRITALGVLLSVVALVPTVLGQRTNENGDPGPAVLGATLLALVTCALGAASLLATHRVDAAVRARLGTPAPTHGRRALGAATWFVVVTAISVAASTATAVDVVARHPGWQTGAGLLVPVLLGGLLGAAVRDALTSPSVGEGAVLDAVDAALARRDLGQHLVNGLPVIVTIVLVNGSEYSQRGPLWLWLSLPMQFVFLAAILANSGVRASTQPLLEDWRLAAATPPQAWLAGAPPSPAVLRESPL